MIAKAKEAKSLGNGRAWGREEPREERQDEQGFPPSARNIKSKRFLQKSFVIDVAPIF
jgi:hypothetical protein